MNSSVNSGYLAFFAKARALPCSFFETEAFFFFFSLLGTLFSDFFIGIYVLGGLVLGLGLGFWGLRGTSFNRASSCSFFIFFICFFLPKQIFSFFFSRCLLFFNLSYSRLLAVFGDINSSSAGGRFLFCLVWGINVVLRVISKFLEKTYIFSLNFT